MAGYNRVVLVGTLTRDPQLSYTPANTPLCKFGLATNRKWKDREGNPQEEGCYVDCALFGRGAEVFNQYMSKGRPVLVEGELVQRRWETQDGSKRSKVEVQARDVQFLGSRPTGEGGGQPARAGGDAPAGPPPIDDDDIPL